MYQFRVIHNDQRYLEHVSYLYQDLFIEWVHNKKIHQCIGNVDT